MNSIKEYLSESNPEAWCIDGMDDALMGVTESEHGEVAVYSELGIIAILMDEDMSESDAIEHLEYNIKGTKFSKNGPIFVFNPT